MVLATSPAVRYILVDEGTSALNPQITKKVIENLKSFSAEGFAVVAISHQQQVSDAADEVHFV